MSHDLVAMENDAKLYEIMSRYIDKTVKHLAKYDVFLAALIKEKSEYEIDGSGCVAFRIDFVKDAAMEYNNHLLRKSVKEK